MSKITFRADDELVEAIESFEASKSEIMREALREYLQEHPDVDVGGAGAAGSSGPASDVGGGTIDALIADRVDELLADRLDTVLDRRLGSRGVVRRQQPQDVNVNVTLDGVSDTADRQTATERSTQEVAEPDDDVDARDDPSDDRKTRAADVRDGAEDAERTCGQCGETLCADHVYCPNCGEKASRRLFCECGDELRSDWAFCPGCGRRTPAADVLDPS